MPPRRDVWQRRIKAVEREYAAVRLAADRLLEAAERDPTVLTREVALRDLRHALQRLDGTYIIRLFAEFESGLRLFWVAARGVEPPSRTRDLVDGVAAMRWIRDEQRLPAHAVRDYRNALVHEREEAVVPVSIADARGRLCRFFSFLPPNW